MLDEGDLIIDGGNSRWTDSTGERRALRREGRALHGRRHERRRLGPRGRLLHDGRRPRRGRRAAGADPRRARRRPDGWGHMGPAGAGHYVKMVHNGVEYGMMQAYAEGFELFDASRVRARPAKIAQLWNQGSRRPLVAAASWPRSRSSRRATTSRTSPATSQDSGEGRWTVDDAIDKARAGAGDHRGAVRALRVAAGRVASRPRSTPRCATSSAATR